jgi:4-aminobutyrate aminotransferase/(S)-3-amino-2-methylpropionate transaminase
LADHVAENKAEDARCLKAVGDIIDEHKKIGKEVAAMIIEPIQAEGGDRHASPEFFRELRQIALDKEVTFIVDEVQTGIGATGEYWAHSHWQLETPPDIVSFSKKAQIAGFFYREHMQVPQTYRIYNTWMGDVTKLIVFNAINNYIRAGNLLQVTRESGAALISGLNQLSTFFPESVQNVRGVGTFCAFDCESQEQRTELVNKCRNRGLLLGVSGEKAIRFRPPLICTTTHIDQALDLLYQSFAEMSQENNSELR